MPKVKLTHDEMTQVWGEPVANMLATKGGYAELSPYMIQKIFSLKRQHIDGPEPSKLAFVYFVECGPSLKVGMTTNVEGRLKTLQTAAPGELKLLRMICCKNFTCARKVEKAIQRYLTDKGAHKYGEWFSRETVDVNAVVEEMRVRFHNKGVVASEFAVEFCREALQDVPLMAMTDSRDMVARCLQQAETALRLDA